MTLYSKPCSPIKVRVSISMKRRQVFLVAVLLVLLSVIFRNKRILINGLAFSGGLLICLVFVMIWILRSPGVIIKLHHSSLPSFRFVRAGRELENKPIQSCRATPESVDSLLNNVIDCFIIPWYQRISPFTCFPLAVKRELVAVTAEIASRLQQEDFVVHLTKKMIPELHDHFTHFSKAEKLTSSTTSPDSRRHAAVAQKYRAGKLHPALGLTERDREECEKHFLKGQVSKIVRLLLSRQEAQNGIVNSLIVQILACTVLYNVIQVLSDSDTINLLIIKVLGENLKHRDQAKQLRVALDQHSSRLHHKSSMANLGAAKITALVTVNAKTDSNSLKKMINSIDLITNVHELTSIRQYVGKQLRSVNNLDVSDASRKSMIDKLQRLKQAIAKRQARLDSRVKTHGSRALQLLEIINNPKACKVFAHYLRTTNRGFMLEFWKEIELIMAPLEDTAVDDLDDSTSSAMTLEFLTLQDIKHVYHRYTEYEQLVALDLLAFSTIGKLLSASSTMSEIDRDHCRRALLRLQGACYQSILETDVPLFRQSHLYAKALQYRSDEGHGAIPSIVTTPLKSADPEETSVSDDILEAVESELTRIIQGTDHLQEKESDEPYVVDDILERSSIGSSEGGGHFDRRSLNSAESQSFERSSNLEASLFDDISDVSSSDTDSSNFDAASVYESPESDIDLYHPSPATLNFAREIESLDQKINTYTSQLKIIEPLLTKAELTNNTTEIKVLRRSKRSLEQELAKAQNQHERLVLQDHESSLFAKSRVWIQLCVTNKENGKEVVLYVVEVQKLLSDNKDVAVAGWIVARRFSQFYKLNEYLKLRYSAQVGKLSFPMRMVHVLKTQQKSSIEKRKVMLEKYLQDLILIPQVCGDETFRSFLSLENFRLPKKTNPLMSVSNPTSQALQMKGLLNQTLSFVSPENFMKMKTELRDFEEGSKTALKPASATFVRLICDLLMEVFNLNSPKAWLRGRAMVVLLQQLFGTTIENKVHGKVKRLFATEASVNDALEQLDLAIFPNGKFRDPPPVRTVHERMVTHQEAKALLRMFMTETCATIFGAESTSYAASAITRMVQNNLLNKNFIYSVLDILFQQLFPETRESVVS